MSWVRCFVIYLVWGKWQKLIKIALIIMPSFFFTYASSRFHGIREGTGPQLLICLHGFGESAMHFVPLAKYMGSRFTIVGIDLPFHGQTTWQENRPFTPQDLQVLIERILKKEQQHHFSLLGYSMGGRLALSMVPVMAPRLRHLILLAPDGIKNNPWHMFVTRTALGNRLFRYVTYKPQLFFRLLTLVRKLGTLNESVYKFAFHSMDKLDKRLLVYNVWTCMRRMLPDLQKCKASLAQYNIRTLLFYGRYDRIIPAVVGQRLVDGTFPGEIVILNKGHQLISEELGSAILSKI
jgi:Predicted hydrolases or acyltransferases (alpha/beta hydrolase superfamily)